MNKRETKHIRGVGGLGLCGQPARAFPISDYGRALFLNSFGEPACAECLKECGWIGSATAAYGKELGEKAG